MRKADSFVRGAELILISVELFFWVNIFSELVDLASKTALNDLFRLFVYLDH